MAIKFGVDASHSDYVIPVVIIKLYDEKGTTNYETMYIRMGGQFSTAIRAAYEDAQGIMGTPFREDEGILGKLRSGIGSNFLMGLQAQIVKGALGAAGMAASAGQTGRNQIEFLTRIFLSNFQQVVYRGPSFRLFSIPFVMKPTSKEEAENMRKIIYLLKIASVPKLGATNITQIFDGTGLESDLFGGSLESVEKITELQNQLRGKSDEEVAKDENLTRIYNELQALIAEDQDYVNRDQAEDFTTAEASPLTFGYPDVCEFELALYQPSEGILKKVFKSDKCVFEAVVADYGSSNKMTFFEDGFYPTEVALTLNLKELVFQTTTSMYEYANNPEGYTIL
jgi:hypothetical protein